MLRLAFVAALAAALAASAAAQTEKSIANAGTLTCTASPPSGQTKAQDQAKLSCKFEPLTGPAATFEGVVRQSGNPTVGDGKIVLIWSVFAPQTDVSAKTLEGTYVGSLGGSSNTPGEAQSGLVGGVDKSIHLRPLAAPDQSGSSVAVSVIELKLSGVPA